MAFSRNLLFEIVENNILKNLESCIRLALKTEQNLAIEQEEFEVLNNGIPESLASLDDKEHPPWEIQTYFDLFDSFPNLRRKAEIVNSYSVLEFGLQLLCSAYEKQTPYKVKCKDLNTKGGYIEKSKKYLILIIGIDFPEENHWKEIKLIQQLRNKLVHNDGEVKTNNQDLCKYIKEHPKLDLTVGNKLIILPGYTAHCYEVIFGFFLELFQVSPKYNKNIKYWPYDVGTIHSSSNIIKA